MSFLARRVATRAIVARRFLPATRAYASQTEQPDYDLENYPKLPDVSHQTRPALGWDDMLERRNIGEPVSHHIR
jgi:NADH dehydrogenase (ubiquinone) 1 beta subcomplex subunit 8